MKKNYQMSDSAATGLAVPESVTVAMAELAADVQEGLLAMAVGHRAAGDDGDDERRCGRGVRPER